MNHEFLECWREECITLDWLSWLGMPMLYDGGLCVNRTAEEHDAHARHLNAKLIV